MSAVPHACRARRQYACFKTSAISLLARNDTGPVPETTAYRCECLVGPTQSKNDLLATCCVCVIVYVCLVVALLLALSVFLFVSVCIHRRMSERGRGRGLQPPPSLSWAKPFLGQMLNFSGRSQQPKMKKKYLFCIC